jgi:hypothetical protein
MIVAHFMKKTLVHYSFRKPLGKEMFLVPIDKIYAKYKHRCGFGTSVHCYFSRIFNEDYKLVNRPRIFCDLMLIGPTDGEYGDPTGVYVDMTDLAQRLSIPDGYILELLAMAFVAGQQVITIFPFETKVDAFSGISNEIEKERELLEKVSDVFEASSFLRSLGLQDIATELSDGHARFEQGDYDGAIKAYRKVVEGFKNFFQQKVAGEADQTKTYRNLIDQSPNRTDKVVGFLAGAYSLLSNFGEHIGTHAFDDEGVFARKLVEIISEYLSKKLRK